MEFFPPKSTYPELPTLYSCIDTPHMQPIASTDHHTPPHRGSKHVSKSQLPIPQIVSYRRWHILGMHDRSEYSGGMLIVVHLLGVC